MKTVFIDIDTQLDFVYPAGALYVPGAEAILPLIAKLNRYAVENDNPLISTMDAHSEDDAEFRTWPPHCVVGTQGQTKWPGTLVGTQVVIPPKAVEVDGVNAQQIILQKVTVDCFQNPNFEKILSALQADRYVVYGVATEICVGIASRGLLKTGSLVQVVTDAIRHLTPQGRDAMFAEFLQAGGTVTTVAEICG
jgi:nicotinamidase/pyrazinamidase